MKWLTVIQSWLPGATGQPSLPSLVVRMSLVKMNKSVLQGFNNFIFIAWVCVAYLLHLVVPIHGVNVHVSFCVCVLDYVYTKSPKFESTYFPLSVGFLSSLADILLLFWSLPPVGREPTVKHEWRGKFFSHATRLIVGRSQRLFVVPLAAPQTPTLVF